MEKQSATLQEVRSLCKLENMGARVKVEGGEVFIVTPFYPQGDRKPSVESKKKITGWTLSRLVMWFPRRRA